MPACSCLDGSCPEGPGYGAAFAPGFSGGARAERRGGGSLCAGRARPCRSRWASETGGGLDARAPADSRPRSPHARLRAGAGRPRGLKAGCRRWTRIYPHGGSRSEGSDSSGWTCGLFPPARPTKPEAWPWVTTQPTARHPGPCGGGEWSATCGALRAGGVWPWGTGGGRHDAMGTRIFAG